VPIYANIIVNNIISNPNHAAHAFLGKFSSSHAKKPTFFLYYEQKTSSLTVHLSPKHPFFTYPYDSLLYIPPIIFLKVRKKENCSREEVQNRFAVFNRGPWSKFKKLYTDGSKTKDRSGAGIWFPDSAIEAHFELHPNSTIFTAEATAISEALDLIGEQDHQRFLIITDSRSVLEALRSFPNSKTHPLIHKIRFSAWKLCEKQYVVRFLWVPSHMGVEGNEIADLAASDFSPSPNILSPNVYACDIRHCDKKVQISSWQNKWLSSPKGRFLFNISPSISQIPWFHNSLLQRHVIVTINRLLCNHTSCADHLFRINIAENNLCTCGDIHSPEHLLFDCNNVDSQARYNFFKFLSFAGLNPANLTDILRSFNHSIFLALHNFFKNADIRI